MLLFQGGFLMDKSKVYFAPVSENEALESVQEKVGLLFDSAEFSECIEPNDLVGLKIHFGEAGNTTHISPEFARPVAEKVLDCDAKPFFTDSNTLYNGKRGNSADHVRLAVEHGFTPEEAGAPVILLGGLRGNDETIYPVKGTHYKEVSLAKGVERTNAFFIMSHVTGHVITGLGANLKNIGMGLASRKGKLAQHCDVKPFVRKNNCHSCHVCIEWCPVDAIEMDGDDKAEINSDICIGCGECVAMCRYGAIGFNWTSNSVLIQEKMVEHAAALINDKDGRMGYINFLINITKDCDCMGKCTDNVAPWIGIIASKDPAAIDIATLDLIKENAGKTLCDLSYEHLDPEHQINHALKMGLGSKEYELVEI